MILAFDWVAVASIATAIATLVLALVTYASVKSASRTARIAEESLAAQLWPLLATARPEDPEQKVMFQDRHKLLVSGGQGAVEATEEIIYFAIALRNVGTGLAVLDRWHVLGERVLGSEPHADLSAFRRLTRDLYIPPGETGFWQGAIREAHDPSFRELAEALTTRRDFTLEFLYSDHLGHQRTVSRFVLMPFGDDRWLVSLTRHWSLDRPDPREPAAPEG